MKAVLYSLLGSCDVVGQNPLECLTDVLGKQKDDMEERQVILLQPFQYRNSRESSWDFLFLLPRA
jgi:hypothetical protein